MMQSITDGVIVDSPSDSVEPRQILYNPPTARTSAAVQSILVPLAYHNAEYWIA